MSSRFVNPNYMVLSLNKISSDFFMLVLILLVNYCKAKAKYIFF